MCWPVLPELPEKSENILPDVDAATATGSLLGPTWISTWEICTTALEMLMVWA